MAKAATVTVTRNEDPNAAVGAPPAPATGSDALTEQGFRYDKVMQRVTRQLAAEDIRPDGTLFQGWSVFSQADHTLADVMHPRYLWNRNEQIRPGDTITIKHPLGFYVVILDVVRIDKPARGILSYVREVHDYTKPDVVMVRPDLAGARIEHLGDRAWCVVDGTHVAKDGFPTRAAAEQWLADMRKE